MLKRYQILLNDWQAEHYNLVSRKYDVSFSEMIRMALCVDIIFATKASFPNGKLKINEKMLKKLMKKKQLAGTVEMEEFHKFLSNIYFEARKATEFWTKALKPLK